MVDSIPPAKPTPVAGLPPEQQSVLLLEEYTDAMKWGTEEARMRQVLIDYIRRVRAWYDRTH